jgi:L-lactate dehydrogenase complex protein LldE
LFVTCLVDTVRPQVGRATVELLERIGLEVVFPREQTCCGQLHANAGQASVASGLAARFEDVFAPYETIVTPSASCAGHVRASAPRLGDRVVELSQLLVERLGVVDVGARLDARVAYHPSCHSLRSLVVGDGPQRLLAAVAGLEEVALAEATECCGFGGTFSVKNADVSTAMLADKLLAIESSGAEVVTACDASCLLHIGGGLERTRSPVRALHLAEILAG